MRPSTVSSLMSAIPEAYSPAQTDSHPVLMVTWSAGGEMTSSARIPVVDDQLTAAAGLVRRQLADNPPALVGHRRPGGANPGPDAGPAGVGRRGGVRPQRLGAG